jgi:hypothetical protein
VQGLASLPRTPAPAPVPRWAWRLAVAALALLLAWGLYLAADGLLALSRNR